VTIRDLGVQRCGIVTLTKDGVEPLAMRDSLRAQAINTSVSPATYARLDMGGRGIPALLRVSVQSYNTDDEIERFCSALEQMH